MLGLDLHMHSHFSDGELSPQQLFALARQKQLHTIAITDHDNIEAYLNAEQSAKEHAIRLISGVEISSFWQRPSTKKSHSVHIVALDLQDFAPMQQLLLQQQHARAKRAREICEKLQGLFRHDFLTAVQSKVDGYDERITRSHIAEVMVEKNIVKRQQQAFDLYLKEGKKAYVPFLGVEMAQAVACIHQCGGFAVLAHPTKYQLSATNLRYMVDLFKKSGGDAMELPPPQDNPATRLFIDRLIAQHQLKVSVGSDFHGVHKPWLSLGKVAMPTVEQVGIWQDFR